MGFINEQLYEEQLPHLRRIDLIGLEKKYLKVLYLNRLISTIIILTILVLALIFLPFEIPTWVKISAISTVLVLLIISFILTPWVFRVKCYGVRSRDILFQSGLIFRSTTIVPFNRVQHVELKSGPVDRMYALARIKIYTAGGSQSDMIIPGLNKQTAERLKELIIQKTGRDEEE